jgi:cytoskeletal protein RodZ
MLKVAIATLISIMLFVPVYSQAETTTSTTVTSSSNPNPTSTDNTVIKTTTTTTDTPPPANDGDQKIVADITTRFANEPALTGTSLTVTCVNGFVTISGNVTAQSQEDQAILVAKSIPNVKGVTSNIDVKTNPKNDKSNNVLEY